MSKEKFTNGPWHNKGKRVFWTKPDHDLPKDNLLNGLVCICAMTEDNPPEVIEEAHANASLIATAPEMYELLNEIVSWLFFCVHDESDMTNKIKQLLAKARGEK